MAVIHFSVCYEICVQCVFLLHALDVRGAHFPFNQKHVSQFSCPIFLLIFYMGPEIY